MPRLDELYIAARTRNTSDADTENLPVKVFATDRWYNILGKPFFDGLKDWRISGDTLIIVR